MLKTIIERNNSGNISSLIITELSLDSVKVCVTGTLKIGTRVEFEDHLKSYYNLDLQNSVGSKTNVLVTNELTPTTKYKAAIKKGAVIVNEDKFWAALNLAEVNKLESKKLYIAYDIDDLEYFDPIEVEKLIKRGEIVIPMETTNPTKQKKESIIGVYKTPGSESNFILNLLKSNDEEKFASYINLIEKEEGRCLLEGSVLKIVKKLIKEDDIESFRFLYSEVDFDNYKMDLSKIIKKEEKTNGIIQNSQIMGFIDIIELNKNHMDNQNNIYNMDMEF